jgi:hypothetical protein
MNKLAKYSSAGIVIMMVLSLATSQVFASRNPDWPVTYTLNATSITSTSATLNGMISGSSSGNDEVWFEYGSSFSPGNYDQSWPGRVGVQYVNSTRRHRVSFQLTDLQPNTTYYYHIKAVNQFGQNDYGPGIDVSFKTKPVRTSRATRNYRSLSVSYYPDTNGNYSNQHSGYNQPTSNNSNTTNNTTNNTTTNITNTTNNTNTYTNITTTSTTNNIQNNISSTNYYNYQTQHYSQSSSSSY